MRNKILFVGGELCGRIAASLDQRQWQILGLRRNPPASATIQWFKADLGVPDDVRALPERITHVIYAPAPDRRTPESYERVYPAGLENLLDALAQKSSLIRFVLVGSTAVWAPSQAPHTCDWVDETTPALPDNFRGATLLRAEKLLQERLAGIGTALRLGGIYGPGRTRLINRLRQGSIIAPSGPGHWSNRIHIDDAATACRHLLELEQVKECYIGTDGDPTETGRFYEQLAQLVGAPVPPRQFMVSSGKRLSNARLVDSGWTPQWPDALEGYRVLLSD